MKCFAFSNKYLILKLLEAAIQFQKYKLATRCAKTLWNFRQCFFF